MTSEQMIFLLLLYFVHLLFPPHFISQASGSSTEVVAEISVFLDLGVVLAGIGVLGVY